LDSRQINNVLIYLCSVPNQVYGTINMTRKVCKHLNRDDVATLKRLQRERERERERAGGRESGRES
jgi:hypothetical protein